MSTFALADDVDTRSRVAAWETLGRIRFSRYSYRSVEGVEPRDVPGALKNCKHPALAVDAKGNVLIAWASGTGWAKGGSIGWQIFDPQLRPIDNTSGKADGLPAWSRPAVVATPRGGFVVLY